MKLFYNSLALPLGDKGTAVTIGNFDGVHQGHQALLKELKKQADLRGLPVVVILFEPQPREFFYKNNASSRLFTLREKLQSLKKLQIDYVYCIRFDKKLAAMSYENFAKTYFFSLLQAKYLLIGKDFRFGYERLGTAALLKKLGERSGCYVDVFQDFLYEKIRVSSTAIRELLAQNDFNRAAFLLGQSYNVCGRVIEGKRLGREWGIPTANINRRFITPPCKGIFCVQVLRERNNTSYEGVANLGYRPTLQGKSYILEIHLLNMEENLYGERLQIYFLHKLRDEIKFSSLDALIAQIRQDVVEAKRWFELKKSTL